MALTRDINILHLSDLHFYPSAININEIEQEKESILKSLIESIKKLPCEWKPSIVCITGDITDKTNTKGFELAKDWLKNLSTQLNIPINRFLICPGNHDGSRTGFDKINDVPTKSVDADKILNKTISDKYLNKFSDYISFRKDLGVEQ